jgi:hypothetical protein
MFERAVGMWRRLTHRPARPMAPARVRRARCCDRRAWRRRAATVVVRLTAAHDPQESHSDARVIDVSAAGIRLLASRRIEPGELVGVGLPGGAEAPTVLACVLRSDPQGDAWALGCRFSTQLNAAELAAFGGAPARRAPSPAPAEQRLFGRVGAQFHVVAAGYAVAHKAEVTKLSPNAVGLLVEEVVPIGALLSTDLFTPDGNKVATMLACVVFVEPSPDGRRLLGCDFIHELSEDAIRSLGMSTGQASA